MSTTLSLDRLHKRLYYFPYPGTCAGNSYEVLFTAQQDIWNNIRIFARGWQKLKRGHRSCLQEITKRMQIYRFLLEKHCKNQEICAGWADPRGLRLLLNLFLPLRFLPGIHEHASSLQIFAVVQAKILKTIILFQA